MSHKIVASEHGCCGDARLGKLQLGTYDVLFQILQILTLIRHLQMDLVSTEKIVSAGCDGVPDCQAYIGTCRHSVA